MEEKKEYLNEENYEQTKKKLTKISLIVLIVGICIGLGLIITGIVLSNNAKGINIDLNSENENDVVLRTESEVQADINAITPKINSLDDEIFVLKSDMMFIKMSEGLSDNYYAKQKQKEAKETELLNLNTKLMEYKEELRTIQSNDRNDNMSGQIDQFENIFNSASNTISKGKYVPFYIFGVFIIIASCMISFAIFMFAKKREITAFTVQQTMPLAKEGIEKMAPTIGSAVGTVGKEIAKGIKEGINEADDNK